MRQGQAIVAGLWSTVDFGLRFAVQFGVSIVLARVLDPVDFGIFALTAVFTALSGILVDGGFSTALIQKKTLDREIETAVFGYNVAVAAVLAVALAAVSPALARFYGFPILRPLLYSAAATLFVSSLGAVPSALLNRSMRFATLAKIGLSASLISGALGLGAALMGAGIWTFPIQAGGAAIFTVMATWKATGWRPATPLNLFAARSLSKFGTLLTLSGLLEVAYTNGYPLIISRLYGARDVGFFNRGQNLQALPGNVISAVVQRVLLPTLSRNADDAVASVAAVRPALVAAMFINVPLMAFLAAFAPLIITVLYGQKWLPAAPVLSILAMAGALLPFHVVSLQIVLAKGRADLFFRVEIAKKTVALACMIVGSLFGIMGLALGHLAFAVIAFFINTGAAARLIGYGPSKQLRDVTGVIVLAAAVVATAKAAEFILHLSQLANLVVLAGLVGGAFVSGAMLFDVGAARSLFASLRKSRDMKPGRAETSALLQVALVPDPAKPEPGP